MGRRELVAAGAVFPPQAPRLGPVAAAGPVVPVQCPRPAKLSNPPPDSRPDTETGGRKTRGIIRL